MHDNLDENDFLDSDYMEESLKDLQNKLNDPSTIFNKKYSQALAEDIAEAIEHIFFISEYNRPINIKVTKDIDNYHLVFEITSVVE